MTGIEKDKEIARLKRAVLRRSDKTQKLLAELHAERERHEKLKEEFDRVAKDARIKALEAAHE